MLIQAYIIVLNLLISTCISAKPGRRKGVLHRPPEFETWNGKWFPFDPTQSSSTTMTTSTIEQTTKNPSTTTTTTPEPPFSNDSWIGKWFPYQSNTIISTKKPKSNCDDGENFINMDFDPTDKRHSYKYLCLTKNRTNFNPNMDLEAIETDNFIPPAYRPSLRCLNESISYDNVLPTFGSFRPLPPKFGTYLYLPPQRWLRSVLEGSIVMLYHPCAFSAQVKLLKSTLKSCLYRHIITPLPDLSPTRPLALIAWGKSLEMSVVNERSVLKFIKYNAKMGPMHVGGTYLDSRSTYEIGLLEEAKLITDTEDSEICGYKEM